MAEKLNVGRALEEQSVVTPDMSANVMGNPGVDVLSTPAVVGILDVLAHRVVLPTLGPGEGTVGSKIDIAHLAATPIGMKLVARGEIVAVEGRRVTVKVTLHDAAGLAAEGTIERVVVDLARFRAKVSAKASAHAG